jgi:DNA polymerase-3 subunit beta
MEIDIDKAALQRELAFLQSVTEKKSGKTGTPVLSNVLLHAETPDRLRVTALDNSTTLITEIEAEVVKPGSALVIADKLFQLTKQLPAGVVNVRHETNDRVRFTLEEIVCRLAGAPADSFPAIPRAKTPAIDIPAEVLRTMIEFVIFARTSETSRFALSSVKFVVDKGAAMMVATNGARLSVIKTPTVTSKEKVTVLLPGKALTELSRLAAAREGSIGYAADENHAYFACGHRTLITGLTVSQFPDFKAVIPKDNDCVLKVGAGALLLPLAAFITYHDGRYRRIPNPFVLSALVGGLVITTVAGGGGLLSGLGGCALAFALMFGLHLFGAMGAGDVKLFAAVGALFGTRLVPSLFLVVLVTGGVLALLTACAPARCEPRCSASCGYSSDSCPAGVSLGSRCRKTGR